MTRAVGTELLRGATCPCCGATIPLDYDVAFMTQDRAYFAAFPDSEMYAREPFPGEHPFACDGATLVIVKRLHTGCRQREALKIVVPRGGAAGVRDIDDGEVLQ